MSAFDDYLKTKPEHWRGGYTEAALEDCWNAAIKTAEALKPSHNSDYAAALRVIEDICRTEMVTHANSIVRIINERLNPAKAQDCEKGDRRIIAERCAKCSTNHIVEEKL